MRLQALAAAAVLLAAASPGGCGPSPTPPSAAGDNPGKLCHADFQPANTGIITGASVKGTVWTQCTVPPQSHALTIHLQRAVNGAWVDQATKSVTQIPPPLRLMNLVTASCIPGRWRVTFTVQGNGPDGRPFGPASLTGNSVEVQPHDCG